MFFLQDLNSSWEQCCQNKEHVHLGCCVLKKAKNHNWSKRQKFLKRFYIFSTAVSLKLIFARKLQIFKHESNRLFSNKLVWVASTKMFHHSLIAIIIAHAYIPILLINFLNNSLLSLQVCCYQQSIRILFTEICFWTYSKLKILKHSFTFYSKGLCLPYCNWLFLHR